MRLTSLNMNKRRFLQVVLCGTACSLLPIPAHAHRQKRAISSIEWNARTNRLEITHTLHLHDAEQALDKIGALKTPDLSPLRARAQLALYTQKRFKIYDAQGHNIQLSIVGAEIDSGYAYVYQEVSFEKTPTELFIENSLLQDIYLDQTNLVNITLGNELKTLIFSVEDKKQKITL